MATRSTGPLGSQVLASATLYLIDLSDPPLMASSIATEEKSTASTAQPESANHRACRPSPQPRSTARPGVSSANLADRAAAGADPQGCSTLL
jgi:hypothetical protein